MISLSRTTIGWLVVTSLVFVNACEESAGDESSWSEVGPILPQVVSVASTTRAIAAPPDYLGTLDGNVPRGASSHCGKLYRTKGYEPNDTGIKHPLFLYFCGTEGDPGTGYDAPPPLAVTEALARRGFVALTVGYDNGFGAAFNADDTLQLDCLFNPAQTQGLLAKACALGNVDCENQGVAVWGHSQGGLVALGGADVAVSAGGTRLVRAAWLAGVGELPASDLPKTRRRVVNGAGEWFGDNNKLATLISLTGATPPGDCPGQPSSQCLRADGSGWVLVSKLQGVIGDDHCWFQANGCGSDKTPASGFVDRMSTSPYALEPNAAWIAATARTPW